MINPPPSIEGEGLNDYKGNILSLSELQAIL